VTAPVCWVPRTTFLKLAVVILAVAASIGAHAGQAAAASHPIETSIQEPSLSGDDATARIVGTRIRQAGATWVRIAVSWVYVAPRGAEKPAGFDASNPDDPHYAWGGIDRTIKNAVASGLKPFVNISEAPAWAERSAGGRAGVNNPDPVELANFARAAATRYSGSFHGLPRVSAWEAWNEPNASFFFMPQWQGEPGKVAESPVLYRQLVNDFAAAVHGVNPTNLVIAGSTFPFAAGTVAIGPLRFMRELLCLSADLKPIPGCGEPLHFDVWSHHPYTQGSPTHAASDPDSASISGLPRMNQILQAAVRQGRIVSSRPVAFWVTEFGWNSNPPVSRGVPIRLLSRWVSEALYRMWNSGVSVASWFFLRDGGGADVKFQCGLYYRCSERPDDVNCDRAKLSVAAFRFPFVAFRSHRRVLIWGRTPGGARGRVIVERSRRGRWKRVTKLRTDRFGIFSRRVHGYRHGRLRARLASGSAVSLPFSLKRPRDYPVSPAIG
jgi:polysaccharide biosynthesis protein PslG